MSMQTYRRELASIIEDTVVAQNADWLGSDFTLAKAGNLIRVSVVLGSGVLVRLVPSTGTAISLGTPDAGVMTRYDLVLDQARTWNLQTNDAAGATINHLCIQEIEG